MNILYLCSVHDQAPATSDDWSWHHKAWLQNRRSIWCCILFPDRLLNAYDQGPRKSRLTVSGCKFSVQSLSLWLGRAVIGYRIQCNQDIQIFPVLEISFERSLIFFVKHWIVNTIRPYLNSITLFLFFFKINPDFDLNSKIQIIGIWISTPKSGFEFLNCEIRIIYSSRLLGWVHWRGSWNEELYKTSIYLFDKKKTSPIDYRLAFQVRVLNVSYRLAFQVALWSLPYEGVNCKLHEFYDVRWRII